MNETTTQQLQSLERDIEQAIKSTRRRNAVSIVFSLATVGLVGYWLSYAHTRFAAVDPNFAADYAQAQLTEYVPQAGADLEVSLKSFAPQLISELETRMVSVPDRFADELENQTKAQLDAAAPQLENELYQSLRSALSQADANVKGKDDEARFKSLLTALADTYRDESIKLTNQLHDVYAKNGTDLLSYVQRLANNQGLTHREQLHREMLQSFLVLAKQTSTASAE